MPYCIPADNPFVGVPGARPEIWAYGLRNPWRFSFDPDDGSLWIGDVGQGSFEGCAVIGSTPTQVTAIGVDEAGELHVVNDLPGQLHRVSFEHVPPPLSRQVGYQVRHQWGQGFTAMVTVTNTGTGPIDGWTLGWEFPGGQRLCSWWFANLTQDGPNATATNTDRNAVIAPAPP